MTQTVYHTQNGIANISIKIYKKRILWQKAAGDRSNSKNTLRLEKDKNNRSRGVPGSYSYALRDTAKGSDLKFHGISQGKKYSDDLRKVSGAEV